MFLVESILWDRRSFYSMIEKEIDNTFEYERMCDCKRDRGEEGGGGRD